MTTSLPLLYSAYLPLLNISSPLFGTDCQFPLPYLPSPSDTLFSSSLRTHRSYSQSAILPQRPVSPSVLLSEYRLRLDRDTGVRTTLSITPSTLSRLTLSRVLVRLDWNIHIPWSSHFTVIFVSRLAIVRHFPSPGEQRETI